MDVDFFSDPFVFESRKIINGKAVCCWRDGPEGCVWRREGVWEPSTDRNGMACLKLLKPNHFKMHPRYNRKINFTEDYMVCSFPSCGALT